MLQLLQGTPTDWMFPGALPEKIEEAIAFLLADRKERGLSPPSNPTEALYWAVSSFGHPGPTGHTIGAPYDKEEEDRKYRKAYRDWWEHNRLSYRLNRILGRELGGLAYFDGPIPARYLENQ